MTDYAWFPVSGDGESQATAFTWNVGTYSFATGSYWANVDAVPPYPIVTGTVPGAVSGGVPQDSIYLFAGSAPGALVNQFYTPNPSKGDPYLAASPDGNYELPTTVLLNTGSVEVNTLGMASLNVGAGSDQPVLEVEGATLHVAGNLVGNYPTVDYPAGVGYLVEQVQAYAPLIELLGYSVNFGAGGTVDIGGGGVVEIGGTIQPGFTFAFGSGSGNTLRLDGVTTAAATGGTLAVGGNVTGFGTGDAIDLPNIAPGIVNSVSYDAATGVLDINVGDPIDIQLNVTGPGLTANSLHAVSDGTGGIDLVTCFAEGTRIATPRGAVAVEALRAGDVVTTVLSGPRRVIWIGRRAVDLRRHRDPARVCPVRVAAGAFGPGLPCRDLVISPDHALYLDGALIPVRLLVNGTSIAPAPVDAVTYYHVELDHHDVLLAEGLAAECYLDTGNRASFGNGGRAVTLHPDFNARVWEAEGCAPLVLAGPRLAAARAAIRAPVQAAAITHHAA
ncbi:Hint domain-containing protein [Acidisphaera rubrifaciens]|uniref:Hedgehog/Intein (Hint) domain-containing protein n=1 Tax=Acidisphaera rubrifaciens HS-AP3 TaxID=1231350 RepID=A0A0D6P3D9_9PROT|nr:Hint domain-containing protein [Acidisphaera rubrifaciens]GAN76275.1 hypothetical protein Asru_0081_11 [Acidisphaera rubrifaciens HS-AP3]